MADQHNELVSQFQNQADPHLAKPEDFKVGNASLGAEGSVPAGKDMLTPSCDAPRHCEDDGPGPKGYGTPTGGDWGAASKSAAFKVETNKGEAGEAPAKM